MAPLGRPTVNSSEPGSEVVSQIDEKDRHDILLQQIINDLAGTSRGLPLAQVTATLADRMVAEHLAPRPQPWLDAVANEAINGNAYVVSATTAVVCDVPKPRTNRSGEVVE